MTYGQFAGKYRFKLKRDPDDDTFIIPGNRGQSHLYDYGENRVGVLIMPETGSTRAWQAARKALLKANMKIVQNGDYEGAATFDPSNLTQVRVAMKYAGVRAMRKCSQAQLATLAKARSVPRRILPQDAAPEALPGSRNDRLGSDDLRGIPESFEVEKLVCTGGDGGLEQLGK